MLHDILLGLCMCAHRCIHPHTYTREYSDRYTMGVVQTDTDGLRRLGQVLRPASADRQDNNAPCESAMYRTDGASE